MNFLFKYFCTQRVPDLINQRYNTIVLDIVWFIDFSNFGNYWIFLIIDCATRRVVAFQIKKSKDKKGCPFNAKDCIKTISNAIKNNPKPQVIHSDNGGQFKNKVFYTFLEQNNIRQSMPNPEYVNFGNQLIERLFRTLKFNLSQIDPDFTQIKYKNKLLAHIEQVVQQYNNNTHSSLLGLSPNTMESAIALYKPNAEVVSHIAQSSSKEGIYIKELQAKVVLQYAGDWAKFFLEWQQEQTKAMTQQTETIIDTVKEQADRVIDEQKLQIHKLVEINQILSDRLESLEKRELQREMNEKEQKELKLRRANRARMPSRDTAGFFELKIAIDIVNEDKSITTFCKSRHIFCLFLLYTTGLRVSNLLKLQVRHVHQMLENQQFDLQLIKKRDNVVQTFCLPNIVYDFLQKELMQHVNELIHDKKDNEFLITAQKSESKSIARELLNKDLNRILKEVSKKTHKNLKTHSFRINLTTALIQAVGIHDASKVIGHKDIRTTERYNRNIITPIQAKNAVELAHIQCKETFVDRRKRSEQYKLQKEINKELNKKKK